MRVTGFQKLGIAALVSVLILMFVGAVVRVTGAGMGCPDWPKCWGCLIPPMSIEEVQFDQLPIEKFQRKAERLGRDPSSISEASLRAEFNARHVWTEFLNRLWSVVVGLCCLMMFIGSFGQIQKRPSVFWVSFSSILVVLINAWMGARVVYSGLKPGILTLHLALAMGLTGLLVYVIWRGRDKPWRIELPKGRLKQLRVGLLILWASVVIEGVLGSQIREITDELAKLHHESPRESWIQELEQSWIYLFHRSFSWVVFFSSLWVWVMSKRDRVGGVGWVENGVLAIVLMQMVLGIVMSQVHLFSWVQVLHVGLAAVLLSLIWLWIFGAFGKQDLDQA